MKRNLLVASVFTSISDKIERFFSIRGYQVDVVRGGVACFRASRQIQPSLLILDWDLPWGGGAGVLACLRESETKKSIPVIVLTENSLEVTDVDTPVVRYVRLPDGVLFVCGTVESLLAATNQRRKSATIIDGAFQFDEQTQPTGIGCE